MSAPPDKLSPRRLRFTLRALFLLVTTAALASLWAATYLNGRRPIEWQEFSRKAVTRKNAKGHNVLVIFTADWDVTSKFNERQIETPTVRRLLRSRGVIPMRADWTDGSPLIKSEINALGDLSIPLIAIYPATGQKPILIRDIVKVDQIVQAISALEK